MGLISNGSFWLGLMNNGTLLQGPRKNASINPNQRGMPAYSKGVACWYFKAN